MLEPIWRGDTVVILATGPSLTVEDAEWVRGKARVIAVNDAYRVAPWADVLYACDDKWWRWHQGVPVFQGRKLSIKCKSYHDVERLCNTGAEGLETERRDGVRTGRNSGYQAIGVAVLLGATRIVLLGYDMRGDHFFGAHPDGSRPPFALCLAVFQTMVQPLRDAGVEVINCTRESALTCFPRQSLHEVVAADERLVVPVLSMSTEAFVS